jgi:putative peptidoglycan lipid II flippase
MLLLAVGLKRKLGSVAGKEIGGAVAKTLVASLVAGASGWGTARALAGGDGGLARAVPGLAGGIVFVAVFVAAASIVRSGELGTLTAGLRRRLGRARA